MVNESYICENICKLRVERNISARDMSLSLGQNPGYINSIENKKSVPSMQMFLYICEFFNITPCEFFDESSEMTPVLADILEGSKHLNEEKQQIVLSVVNGLQK